MPERTMTNASTDRNPWLWAVLLVAIVLAVFGRVVWHDFSIWDDETHVVNNPHLNPVSWHGVKRLWTEPYFGLYVPLSYTLFAAEATIAQRSAPDGAGLEPNPMVFHTGSLLLHAAVVLLVFVILRRLVRHDAAALFGALLFALHPVQVESVAWISETRGLLCAVFSLLAIWRYLDAASQPQWDRHARRAYLAASLALLLALLAKPSAVAVPAIVGVLDLAWLRRDVRRVLPLVLPWLAMAVVWVVITRGVQSAPSIADTAPWWARPLVAGDALAFYVMKLVWPWPLCVDYGRSPSWVMQHGWIYVAWFVPAALVALLAWLPNRRTSLVAAALFAVWLLPVLGLVPFSFQRISTVADRYLYLALLGPALALSWLLAKHWNRWTIGATSAVLCLLAGVSFVQSGHWRDDATLLNHALEVNPRSIVARQNLGALRDRDGDYQGAVALYRQALKDHPNSAELRGNLGASLITLGEPEAGLAELREAVRLNPRLASLHFKLANGLKAQGMIDQAIEQYRKAVDIVPGYVDAHVNLGAALERTGDVAGARKHYQTVLAVRPDCATAHFNLGNLAQNEPGGLPRAVEHYRRALQCAPRHARAHVNLGTALRSLGRNREAIEHFRAARQIDRKLLEAHANLGFALLDEGRRDEAKTALREALRLAPPGSAVARRLQEILGNL